MMAPSTGKRAKSKPVKKTTDTTADKSTTTKPSTPTAVNTVQYEFGGPIGALGVVLGLPLVTILLFFLCNKDVCVENPLLFDWKLWMATRYCLIFIN